MMQASNVTVLVPSGPATLIAFGPAKVPTPATIAPAPLPMAPNFLGFVSDTAFTTVTFFNPLGGGNNDQFGLDNLTTSGGGAIPEPGTWALMIGGFGLAGAALRRRQAAAA